ncbi:hypothetical protein V8D89_002167 [Ganoderma adspersum]
MAHLQLPLEIVVDIIDLVAANYPRSLPSCARVSRNWNLRSAYHLHLENVVRVCVAIARLPIELLNRFIDLVAEQDPDSLPSCALVSRQWNLRSTYHLQRLKKTFRHVKITTIPELHEVFDIAKENAGVCQWPTSLEVSPDPGASSSSYIPFLQLPSRTLPNVTRLVWGETLRWTHYPRLYNNGAVGSSFHAVVALDLHCRFKSPQHLFRAVRSFKNLEEVRLLHPDPFPLPVPQIQVQAAQNPGAHAIASLSSDSEVKLQKPLRLLEIPLSVLRATLEISGDYIMNLSIRCPPASALSIQVVAGEPATFPSSLLSLETVSITVPTEPFNPANAGLQKLRRLVVAPIHCKVGVGFSLFLMRCVEHSAVGYRVEGLSRTTMLEALRTPAKMNPLKPCQACAERSAAATGTRETPSQRTPQLPFKLHTPVRVVSESLHATPESSVPYPEPRVPVTPRAGESMPGLLPYGFNVNTPQPAWVPAPEWSNLKVLSAPLVDVMGTAVPNTVREGPNTPIMQVSVWKSMYAAGA